MGKEKKNSKVRRPACEYTRHQRAAARCVKRDPLELWTGHRRGGCGNPRQTGVTVPCFCQRMRTDGRRQDGDASENRRRRIGKKRASKSARKIGKSDVANCEEAGKRDRLRKRATNNTAPMSRDTCVFLRAGRDHRRRRCRCKGPGLAILRFSKTHRMHLRVFYGTPLHGIAFHLAEARGTDNRTCLFCTFRWRPFWGFF